MSKCILQRLLSSGEYDELEDVVIAEGEFVETDVTHQPIRQVVLGMTPLNLIIACRFVTNYKDDPEVYYQTDIDPFLDDLEISSVVSICLVRVECSQSKYELMIKVHERINYYEMTNTLSNGCLEDTWAKWQERADYIKEDPYMYIRAMFDDHGLPYPDYYANHKTADDSIDSDNSGFNEEDDLYIFPKTMLIKPVENEKQKKHTKEKKIAKDGDSTEKKKKK